MRRSKVVSLLVALTTIAVLSVSAFGAYSPVMSGREPNHTTILGDVYGGTFTNTPEAISLDYGMWSQYTNGSITVYRINDLNGEAETLNIITNGPNDVDQIWTNGVTRVTATAKYAGLEQSFGWNGGGSDTTEYYELLNESVLSKTFDIEGDFLWGINPDSYLWWSRDSLNDDTVDHMITYKIKGLMTNETVWMVFWEDLPSSHPWDQDYQDFVVEIRAIPEPGSMLLLGLGALALIRKRRA